MGEATGRERAIGAIGLMDWVQLGLVTVLAGAVQGAVGFAFTLLTVSFFLLILQSAEAIQVLLVLNLVICGSLCDGTLRRALPTRGISNSSVGAPVAGSGGYIERRSQKSWASEFRIFRQSPSP